MLCTAVLVAAALSSLSHQASASPVESGRHASNTVQTRQFAIEAPTNSTPVLKRNCAFWGWYPDDGNKAYQSQGTLQTLAELNAATGTPAFAVGAYAHINADTYDPLDPSTYFNGSEILPYIQQALAANATFVASIAPVHGYQGFQANDTNQATAIVNVLRNFVDAGVQVWLRWGHEFNYYTTKGSDDQDPTGQRHYYAGNANDFVNAWKVTYTTIKAALPSVQFMWCANVGSMSELQPFWPGPSYVDSVALDYYTLLYVPQWQYTTLDPLIVQTHDTFALPYGKPFYLGETGTRSNSSTNNLNWIKTITSEQTCESMPNYEGAFWFNYQKNDIDHRIVVPGGSNVTSEFVELMTGGPAPAPSTLNLTDTALAYGFRSVVKAAKP